MPPRWVIVKQDQLLWLSVALVLGTFAADVVTPMGVAVPVLYLLPVVLGLWTKNQDHAVRIAIITSVLTVIGAMASPPNGDVSLGVTNRILALLAVWATATGVTYTRRMGETLRRATASLEETQYALDQSAIVCATDLKGNLVQVNDRFCERSGYGREELLGKSHQSLNSGTHPASFFAELWSTVESGRSWRGEICNRAKDGTLFWLDTTIVPLCDAEGKPRRYLAIRHDVTARRFAEARLREQAALARLGEMAAVVAHEVKNPLTGISGALQIIGERLPAGSRDRKVLVDIRARIASLNDSVCDLLLYARPRAPNRTAVDVQAVLRETASLVSQDAAMRAVTVEVGGDHAVLSADPAMLREVFLNLVLNAGQAMNGQGSVRVEARDRGARCEVAVIDHGPGIPEELRERVFEPFFTTRSRGTGLGLAIVRRTVEVHGGEITLHGTPGGGTTMTVVLPTVA